MSHRIASLLVPGGRGRAPAPFCRRTTRPSEASVELMSESLVAHALRLRLAPSRGSLGLVELSVADNAPAERDVGLSPYVENEPEPFLDLDASLEQTRSQFAGATFCRRYVSDRRGDQARHPPSSAFSSAALASGECHRGCRPGNADPGSLAEDASSRTSSSPASSSASSSSSINVSRA